MIDTGVLPSNSEFAGARVDAAPELQNYLASIATPEHPEKPSLPGYAGSQHCGPRLNAMHGTATASIAGGSRFGVAKGATIVDARGIPCSGGFNAWTITKVVDWICRLDIRRVTGRSVINMSFSGFYNAGNPDHQALQAEINTAVDTYNIPVVCAAGNDGGNEFWYMPGNASRAITVAGSNRDSDTQWVHSNYGYTVSFYAPAQYLESATTITPQTFPTDHEWVRSEAEGNPWTGCGGDSCESGTSFSAPHMSGAIARYLQRHSGATRDQIVTALQTMNATYSGIQIPTPDGGTLPLLNFIECP